MKMQDTQTATLSARQAEIAQLVVSGKSTREIAQALTLSPRTVESHIAAIYDKFGVSSRAELIIAGFASAAGSTNLPAPRAGLLGRETDVANISSLLQESRLVTLTGSGGIGKTRAALALGEAGLADFKHGVWFVELASLARESSVVDAVARALNIELPRGIPAIESVRVHLRQRSLLLILDNCEHLIGQAAATADAFLRGCPQLRMLATSREPLRIAGERTYRLPSLRVPAASDVLALDAARGATYAAIELFRQRAQAVDHEFTLTDDNIGCVAEICRRVDGIPLAIELAAARVTILSVKALATKLESHMRILGGGDRTALPRHQTMHALIDWSYALLEPHEQRVFERLAVFTGGCALPEAVAVAGDDSDDEVVVLDRLSSLVDKSLVFADATGPHPRYGLLQTFAQYGREKLAARGDLARAARCHAAAYLDLAERLEAEYEAAPSTAWYARVEREVANWQSALQWTLEARGDVPLGQRLVAALRPMLRDFEGAQRWLSLAHELIDERTPPIVALALRYTMASFNLEFGEAQQTVTEGQWLGEEYKKLGNPVRAARCEGWVGTALLRLGRIAEAEAAFANALAVAREHGQRALIAYILGFAGMLSFTRGDAADGRSKYAESLAIYESIGAYKIAALRRLNLADNEFECGNVDQAVELATSGLLAVRQFGAKTNIAMGLMNLAAYCMAAGRWTAAHGHAREAVDVMKETQNHCYLAVALQHVAAVAVLMPSESERSAQTARAARLLGYIDAAFMRLGYARQSNEQREYDRVLAALGEKFTAHDLAMHLADGAALTPDQAVELALAT